VVQSSPLSKSLLLVIVSTLLLSSHPYSLRLRVISTYSLEAIIGYFMYWLSPLEALHELNPFSYDLLVTHKDKEASLASILPFVLSDLAF
jgi:hypothetical protein